MLIQIIFPRILGIRVPGVANTSIAGSRGLENAFLGWRYLVLGRWSGIS